MMMKHSKQEYFASCPKGIEILLEEELVNLGCTDVKQTLAGVFFTATQKKIYEVCLWTRMANRILMPVAREPAKTSQDVYSLVYHISWEDLLPGACSFVVDFIGTNNDIRNTQFGAQRVKDAIVDRCVRLRLPRPNVDKKQPDIRINVRLSKMNTIVSVDLSGESLHRRGYRGQGGGAPLKENLAAALLTRAGWPSLIEKSRSTGERVALIDPMCGSGTLLIEGGLIAANIAPGLLRPHFGFEKLKNHDEEQWFSVVEQAKVAKLNWDEGAFPLIEGFDIDNQALVGAKKHVENAGLEDCICVARKKAADLENPDKTGAMLGLMICNPPYGERMGEIEALREEYRILGQAAKSQLLGWRMAVFTSNELLAREMRLRSKHRYQFYNGTIPTQLMVYEILGRQAVLREDKTLTETTLSEGASMVANRIKKNKKRLQPWLRQEQVECFRVYDADIPEYAAAIDVYGDSFHIQEYQAPKKIDGRKTEKRFDEIVHATVHAFNADPKRVISKTRMRHKGKSQYRKLNDSHRKHFQQVCEGKAVFNVNLTDYLDTGLFLDHRPLRKRLYESALGKSFLNLFCYTATATVHACLGGATKSVSVDLSNTYLNWAKRNFELNNIRQQRHKLVRADCLEWLNACRQGFDIIMLDPPTFSNSKNTETVLDIQKDHGKLIDRCVDLLNPGGVLYFSNNLRSFVLDEALESRFDVENISAETIDPDFERNKKIHVCWTIRRK